MFRYEFNKEQITSKELMFVVANMVIGAGIFRLPAYLAENTNSADGVLSILITGIVTMAAAWTMGRLVKYFPNTHFYEFSKVIITKPAAWLVTLLFGIHFMMLTAYEIRAIAQVTRNYLLPTTPIEVLSLLFLFVIQYAVVGSRVSLIRLNTIFLPIVLSISFLLPALNIELMEVKNLLPVLTTDVTGYAKAMLDSYFSFIGFSVIVFYSHLIKDPDNASKEAAKGILIVILLYMMIHIACISIFSNDVTANINTPTIELGKEVELPGGFFERFESVFFTIWIMTIFNTTSMSMDISLLAFTSLFKRLNKKAVVLAISPIIYLIGIFPKNLNALDKMGEIVSYAGLLFTLIVVPSIFLIAKIRGLAK